MPATKVTENELKKISEYALKSSPFENDSFIIEDSEDSGKWKKVKTSDVVTTTYGEVPSFIPIGSIQMYVGGSAPSGWLICDGVAVSRSTYSDLFSVLGEVYGSGDGSATFNLPDLTSRTPVQLDSSDVDFDSLNGGGGVTSHTLSFSELPTHSHSSEPPNTNSSGHTTSHDHEQYVTANPGFGSAWRQDFDADSSSLSIHQQGVNTSWISSDHNHLVDIPPFNTGSQGGGLAHNNLHPFLVVNYIIKAT